MYEECTNSDDSTYLFDLDGPNRRTKYVIDASETGNESRFINHSCSPNLDTVSVVGYHGDPALTRIAFFANQDIEPGDELTFNYFSHQLDYTLVGPQTPRCHCGAHKCRGYLI